MAQSDAPVIGVVNSTPLIALSRVGHLALLPALFDEIFIPPSVYEEVAQKGYGRPGSQEITLARWYTIQGPQESVPLPAELLGLDRGEIDVILLARELEADWVLIDEKLARQIAIAMGLQVKGTLGVLLVAYRLGLLTRTESLEAVHELAQSSVRLSDKLVRWFERQVET
jgi:predicted nucleic acid-binding protein